MTALGVIALGDDLGVIDFGLGVAGENISLPTGIDPGERAKTYNIFIN